MLYFLFVITFVSLPLYTRKNKKVTAYSKKNCIFAEKYQFNA